MDIIAISVIIIINIFSLKINWQTQPTNKASKLKVIHVRLHD